MKPNVQGIRFVADMIELHQNMYHQGMWGDSDENIEIAGTGISCGTPACIAGFAVQFLGNREEYEKNCDYADGSWSHITPNYATYLFGLDDNWSDCLFEHFWHSQWLEDGKLEPLAGDDDDNSFQPSYIDAVRILRRLADQFEEEEKGIAVEMPVTQQEEKVA